MPTQQTITAGIDGSPESLDAARWAAREALRRDLPLHLVHAGGPPAKHTRPPDVDAPAHRENNALDRTVLHIAHTHPTLAVLDEEVAGPPVEALLAAARSSALLVVGSRGSGALSRALIGSVALAVAARASCPVALVRASADSEGTGPGPAEGPDHPVVLGLDLERAGDELLEYAFDAAASREAPLHVVHVWTAPLIPSADAIDPRPEKEHRLAAELAPWRHKFPGTRVTGRLVHGLVGHHVVKAARAAGLLVIGRRVPAGPRLGRTTHAALHHARCPVVVVPHY
ncbi:stress-inducible protein [Streptomyces longisporoflavus]|uniref:universal stress protein n=1 Tax=Streptomyces longisporoflavus TaxID=28044 RepID=UPI00167D0BB9|nr:universal stress protein [Streptomyces longisporoflavus]GGV29087.1 stress-inducible protein [Streptomyces longisporoflavus]